MRFTDTNAAFSATGKIPVETATEKGYLTPIQLALPALQGAAGDPTKIGKEYLPVQAASNKIAYVSSTGNDGTGQIGNPNLPYLTGTAAFNAAEAAAAGINNHIVHFGVGSFSIIITGDIPAYVMFTGEGPGSEVSINFTGANGTSGSPNGENTPYCVVVSDGSVRINAYVYAGIGWTPDVGGVNGGDGGSVGDFEFRNCTIGQIELVAGAGGDAFELDGGSGGSIGIVYFINCTTVKEVGTKVTVTPGFAGVGGPNNGTIVQFYAKGCIINEIDISGGDSAEYYTLSDCVINSLLHSAAGKFQLHGCGIYSWVELGGGVVRFMDRAGTSELTTLNAANSSCYYSLPW